MGETSIEWTERTWNPIVGCSIVSPGCTNCYAMKMASRLEAMGNQPRYAGTTKKVNGKAIWTGKLALAPESTLLEPLRRKKPTTYFVNSMGDLFHEDCPDEWIDRVFAVMALCPQHTFQVLTKRAARMRSYFDRYQASHDHNCADMIADEAAALMGRAAARGADRYAGAVPGWPLPNVWLGVSTERQKEADERIPHLLQTPAAVRFISAEPLLGLIDLTRIADSDTGEPATLNAFSGTLETPSRIIDGEGCLDWVIVGGESGPDARPMHPKWVRALRDQCANAAIRFFFKQWGQFVPFQGDMEKLGACGGVNYYNPGMKSVGKKAAGRLLDGVEHNEMPGKPS